MSKPWEKPYIVNGLPIDRAPPFLTPYSDCVDGIVCIPEGPNCPGSRWQLSRGGRVVGEVVALWEDIPYGSGPDRRGRRP